LETEQGFDREYSLGLGNFEYRYMITRKSMTLAYGPFDTFRTAHKRLSEIRNPDDLEIVPILHPKHI